MFSKDSNLDSIKLKRQRSDSHDRNYTQRKSPFVGNAENVKRKHYTDENDFSYENDRKRERLNTGNRFFGKDMTNLNPARKQFMNNQIQDVSKRLLFTAPSNYSFGENIFAGIILQTERWLTEFQLADSVPEILDLLYREQKQVGGSCNSNLIWGLEYGNPDSIHDFGKGRNGLFPKEKPDGKGVLSKLKHILSPLYEQTMTNMNDDQLYQFYDSNPSNFEPVVKHQMLLGNICNPVEDVSFFFSAPLESKEWIELRQQLNLNTPDNIDTFVDKLKEDYKYFVFDAMMSIQKEKAWDFVNFRSLCNLWDPAGASSFGDEFTDNKHNLILVKETFAGLVSEEENLYDSKSNGVSLYDYAYDPLLNKFCLEKDIRFKLRIRKINDKWFAALVILAEKAWVYTIETGGFGVLELSQGLLYVESNYTTAVHPTLKQIIDKLRELLKYPPDKIKEKLYTFLFRCKSSGDHGSAQTARFMNEVAGNKTLYLSGDILAFTYAILIKAPTVFRYAPQDGEKEDRVHFIGAYLPVQDPDERFRNTVKEMSFFYKKTLSPVLLTDQRMAEISAEISEFLLMETLSEDNKLKLKEIDEELAKHVFGLEKIKQSEYKNYDLSKVKQLIQQVVCLTNQELVAKIAQKVAVMMSQEMSNIISVQPEKIFPFLSSTQGREPRSNALVISNKSPELAQLVKKSVNAAPNDFIKKLKELTVLKDKETLSGVDEILAIKQKMDSKRKQIKNMINLDLGAGFYSILQKSSETMLKRNLQHISTFLTSRGVVGEVFSDILLNIRKPDSSPQKNSRSRTISPQKKSQLNRSRPTQRKTQRRD